MSEINSYQEIPQEPGQYVEHLVENLPGAIVLTIALLSNAAMAAYINWARIRLNRMKYRRKWSLDQELEAQRIAAEIRVLMGADRVVFSYFHNNEVALSGLHFKKITAYVEAKDPWTASVIQEVRGIPVTLLLGQILELIKMQGAWKRTDRKDVTEEGCLRHLRKTNVATQFERVVLNDRVPLALVTVHYFQPQPYEKVIPLEKLDQLIDQIPGTGRDD